jgi:hypothetical protein
LLTPFAHRIEFAVHRMPRRPTGRLRFGVACPYVDRDQPSLHPSGEAKVEIRAGDVIWCPPGHKHWHGATATTSMTHIAIQEALDGVNVVWMDKVSDEDYMSPVADAVAHDH